MRGFVSVIHEEYARRNAANALTGADLPQEQPSRTDVAVAAYLDTARIDFDRLTSDDVTILILDDLGPSADFAFGLACKLFSWASDADWRSHEILREMSEAGERSMVNRIVAENVPVLIVAREQAHLGSQLPRMASRVLFAQVDQALVDEVAEIFWAGGKKQTVKDWEPNLTDILVALKGAKLREHYYDSIVSYEAYQTPEAEKPVSHIPKVLALSAMSGFGEAFDWGMQLSEDLADYRAGKRAWADMDVGVLLTSPPGGGKTTFARALAAECDCPFFPTTYTDWAGGKESSGDTISKRLTQLFAEWRKAAKESGACIVFIDEIDSIGKRGVSDKHDYWFGSVINSWLAFLDGAIPRDGIIVIAATNFPDRVDDALRRPGRLDRHVRIPLPDLMGIEGILDYHLGSVEDAVQPVARALRGKSPAVIMQVCKDARRHARSMGRPVRAADVLRMLPPPREDADEDRLVCVHEAGHAVAILDVGFFLESVDVDAGVTHNTQPETSRAEQFRRRLHVAFAGRAAEEVVLGQVGVGCASDLRHASMMAQAWHFQMGHGGLVYYDPGAALTTAQVEVCEAWLQKGYAESVALIRRREYHVRKLAAALKTRRFMEAHEVVDLLRFDREAFRRTCEARYDEMDRRWGEIGSLDPRQMAA